MKLEEGSTVVGSVNVLSGGRAQKLVVESGGTLALLEGPVRLRSWPLHIARLRTDLPNAEISVEMGGEIVKWVCLDETSRSELARAAVNATSSTSTHSLSEAELGALLEDTELDEGDAEKRVKRLGEKLAKLDALNVGGMLAAATEGGGAKLAKRLEEGSTLGASLSARVSRLEALSRGGAGLARSGAARADASARALRNELLEIFDWLDSPALANLDTIHEISLATPEGRSRALHTAEALRVALKGERTAPAHRLRLHAVRERLRRLARARDHLAAALARHLNNALIHLANEAAAPTVGTPGGVGQPGGVGTPGGVGQPGGVGTTRRHHTELQPYAPFMRWLREMDEKAYEALVKVYVGTWSKVYEREVSVHTAQHTLPEVLTLVERICNAEQDFCTHFFALDYDPKEGSDGDRSERSAGSGAGGGAGGAGGREARRLMAELFPALEQQLVALLAHLEKDPYGAMRALACLGRVVLGGEASGTNTSAGGANTSAGGANVNAGGANAGTGGANASTGDANTSASGANAGASGASVSASGANTSAGGANTGASGGDSGEARWSRLVLAAVAVAAKRAADRAVADRIAALPDAVKQAAKKPKCGILSFIPELEEMSEVCEAIFAGGRRADLDRWYLTLCSAMVSTISTAEHPRTPRDVVQMENYHRLHAVVSALRVPALDPLRRDARKRYHDALARYVTHYFGRPLDKITQFFEGVSEAVAGGAREAEVCYRAAYSKHALRRLLALYPAGEVRRALARLYRTCEKHLSDEGGLLQVVWRAMQEEFIAQHVALQARIAACYPGAGLSLPLSTEDILDAFSEIAREH